MWHVSKIGLAAAGAFLALSVYLIATQGLFGESFIALILGMPWVLALSYVQFFNPQSEMALGTLLLFPILINAALIYTAVALIEWGVTRRG